MKFYFVIFFLALLFPSSLLAKNYYISAEGNDADNGSLENPWLSLAKVSAAAANDKNGGFFQPGDSILFRAGDSFEGQLVCNRSGSELNPIVFGYYGEGEKPILSGSGNILTGDFIEVVKLINSSYIVMEGLWIKNDRKNIGNITWGTNSSTGILVQANEWGGISKALTFRDLKISDIFSIDMLDWEGKFTLDYYNAIGIYFDSEKNDLTVTPIKEIGIEDVLIEDCYFYNIGSRGISCRHLTNVRNNLIDEEDRNMNFIIRNNTFQQLGGDGVVFASLCNGLVENNEFIDLGWGDYTSSTDRYYGRGEGCWVWNARNIIVQNNKQYRARGFGDTYGPAGHIDFFCRNVIFQYNYSEETEGGFCEILGDCQNSTFRYNVSVNDGDRANGHNRYSIWLSGYVGKDQTPVPSDNNYIYNNTVYLDKAVCKPDIEIFAKNTYIYNNIFYAMNDAQIGAGGVNIDIQTGSEFLVSNNLFYGDIAEVFTNLDNNKVLVKDPLFTNPVPENGGLENFNIQLSSPAIDAGKAFPEPAFPMAGQGIFKDITSFSSADAYGNPVDIHNTIPNIGASNVHNSGKETGISSQIQTTNFFTIYPNPVKGFLGVSLYKAENEAELEIYSIQGTKVYTSSLKDGIKSLKIQLPESLRNGIYYIRFREGKYFQTKSFVLYRD
jgi:type IX secretion system substrate protein